MHLHATLEAVEDVRVAVDRAARQVALGFSQARIRRKEVHSTTMLRSRAICRHFSKSVFT